MRDDPARLTPEQVFQEGSSLEAMVHVLILPVAGGPPDDPGETLLLATPHLVEMCALKISEFYPGHWHCGQEYPKIYVTKIAGPGDAEAYVWMSNINIDFDGAPNAYGPPGTDHLDHLENAGPGATNGWYGVVALSPKQVDDIKKDLEAKKVANPRIPKIDTTAKKDVFGRFPVIQQAGEPKPGLYVSASAVPANSNYPEWDQRRWIDSSAIPYGALSGMLRNKGELRLGDCGLAMRFGIHKDAGFTYKDSGGKDSWAVGECSYKLFLNLGGVGKNNWFQNGFIVFPHTRRPDGDAHQGVRARLGLLSLHDTDGDLPLVIAFSGMAGKGGSGYELWKRYRSTPSRGMHAMPPPRPASYLNVLNTLRGWGYQGAPGL